MSLIATVLFMSSVVTISAETKDDINADYIVEYEDGGKDYVFIIAGEENHCMVPPEGFNPLDATDEMLAKYCFPPRPETPEELREWTQLMKNYKNTPKPELDMVETSKIKKRAMDYVNVYSSSTIMTGYSGTMSGYRAFPYLDEEVSQVQMNYRQPSVTSVITNCKNRYGVAIGDCAGVTSVRAGTATEGQNVHYAWYQTTGYYVIPEPQMVKISSLTINAGDSIHLYISFEKENNIFTYYIANNTTGQAASGRLERNAADYYDGSTAQWYVERGKINDMNLLNLGNFGTFTPSMCQYKVLNGTSWNNITNANIMHQIDMKNFSANRILATTSSIFGGSCFTCTWQGYN